MSAWVRNGVLMGADELVAELGGDLTALRREVGLEPLDDPDFPIPVLAVVEFLERAASVCACEAFGLLLSQKQDFSIFGPLWPFFRRASTVGEVLHDLAEFFPVHTQGALVVVEKTPDGAVLRYDPPRVSGRANGNYRHGGRTKGVADLVRYINALARKARDFR